MTLALLLPFISTVSLSFLIAVAPEQRLARWRDYVPPKATTERQSLLTLLLDLFFQSFGQSTDRLPREVEAVFRQGKQVIVREQHNQIGRIIWAR